MEFLQNSEKFLQFIAGKYFYSRKFDLKKIIPYLQNANIG